MHDIRRSSSGGGGGGRETTFSMLEMELMLRATVALADKCVGARMWSWLLIGMRQREVLGELDLRLHKKGLIIRGP